MGDPSWLLSPPSSRCGSPSRSTTSLVPPSSTESASKKWILVSLLVTVVTMVTMVTVVTTMRDNRETICCNYVEYVHAPMLILLYHSFNKVVFTQFLISPLFAPSSKFLLEK